MSMKKIPIRTYRRGKRKKQNGLDFSCLHLVFIFCFWGLCETFFCFHLYWTLSLLFYISLPLFFCLRTFLCPRKKNYHRISRFKIFSSCFYICSHLQMKRTYDLLFLKMYTPTITKKMDAFLIPPYGYVQHLSFYVRAIIRKKKMEQKCINVVLLHIYIYIYIYYY